MGIFGRSRRRDHGSEEGIAMLATLVTLIVLGVMAVIMFNTLGGSPAGTGTGTTLPGATETTAPATPENGAREAAVSACQANYLAIETALSDYRSLNGSSPPAGAAWATAAANGGPYLQVWPESAPYYSIKWNGAQLSVIPVRGASSQGSDGTNSPKSGCFAA
jgi:type II secretory pathway pseudopilin PulG